jgi:hypothetical protein
MTWAQWVNWGTQLVTFLVTSGAGYLIYKWLFNRQALKDEKAREEKAERDEKLKRDDEQERRERERREILAAAQDKAQQTALTSYHEANESLRQQCTDCQVRLTDVERELRHMTAVLRATVRALDKADPALIELAIAAARELI